MTSELRIALAVGVAFGVSFVCIKTWRHRGLGWPVSELLDGVSLLFGPLLVPGSLDMIVRSVQSDPLPLFNQAEERIALFLGGTLLLASVLYTVWHIIDQALREQVSLAPKD